MKCIVSIALLMFLFGPLAGQDLVRDSLKAQKAEKQAAISALQSEINAIDTRLNAYTGWKTGVFGTIGYNLSSFSNWRKGANPNSISSTILGSANAFANLKEEKYFWRNSGGLNLGWQKLDTDNEDELDAEFEKIADVFKLTSLFGYNISDKLALSTLGEYNSALLSDFNNPGILDLGVGFTWLPLENMVVVVHPVNYHWVFGDDPDFDQSLGAKLVVDYTRDLVSGLTWKSNLTGFLSYKETDPGLSEYTWTNTFAFQVFKSIGVGIEFAIRNAPVEYEGTQNYWVFGLSYAF